MFSDIDASDNQMKYYKSGIGTYAQPSWKSYTYAKQVAENKIDLAIAWCVDILSSTSHLG